MKKEMERFENLKVLKEITFAEAAGHKLIGLRWVLRQSKDSVKARLAAQEVNVGSWADAFAATPTLVGQIILTWVLITRPNYVMGVLDISTAFLQSEIPYRQRFFLEETTLRTCCGCSV